MKNKRIYKLAELAILSAIIILMSFTPIGYLKIFAFEITFVLIPVIIGCISLGTFGGAFLGALFGITSFIQAFSSPLGAVMLEKSIFLTFLVCFFPRLICGLITGFTASKLQHTKNAKFILPSIVAPLLNTIFFVSLFFMFFLNDIKAIMNVSESMNIVVFFFIFIGWNALIEFISCILIGSTVSKAVDFAKHKNK